MENLITNYEELHKAVNDRKSFVEVSEDLYYEALGSVPPIYLKMAHLKFQNHLGEDYFILSDGRMASITDVSAIPTIQYYIFNYSKKYHGKNQYLYKTAKRCSKEWTDFIKIKLLISTNTLTGIAY